MGVIGQEWLLCLHRVVECAMCCIRWMEKRGSESALCMTKTVCQDHSRRSLTV